MASYNDPVTDEMLNISTLNMARRKAELAYEEAKMHEQVNARTSIPKVMAQLQEQQMKAAKQKEQIQKQQAAQGMTSQQMLPQMTDVSGQTTGRSGQQGASIANEIFNAVSGGAAIKNGTIAWGTANTLPPTPGTIPQNLPQGAAPSTQPIPQNVHLGAGERVLSGIGTLLSLAGRQPQGIINYGKEAITGERTVGYTSEAEQQVLAQKQLDLHAQPLSIMRARSESDDPAVKQDAQQKYASGIELMTQQYGPEYAQAVKARSDDLFYAEDEKRRAVEEAPAFQKQKQMLDLQAKVLAGGEKGMTPEQSLNPGELALFKNTSRATNITNVLNPVTPANRTAFQREVDTSDVLIGGLNQLGENMFNEDGTWNEDAKRSFTLPGEKDYLIWQAKDKAGDWNIFDPISGEDQKRFNRYATIRQNMAMLNVPYMHSLIGATMSPQELERIDQLLVLINKSPTENAVAFRELRERVGLAKLRYVTMLNTPEFQGMDPEKVMPYSNSRQLARDQADKVAENMRASGVPENEIDARVEKVFYNAYGIDLKSLFGKVPGSAQ